MTIPERLEAFRSAVPGCSVAALGDMAAGLVLRASHDGSVAQERLDHLCVSASALLAGSGARDAGMAVALHGLVTEVFVRSTVDRDDVLCCVCGPNVDISVLARLARQALSDMVQRG